MRIKLVLSLVVLTVFFLGNAEPIQFVFAETENENINFFLDKTWYDPRDNIHVQGWVNIVKGPEIQIEIINPKDLIIFHENVALREPPKIDHTIGTFGQEWSVTGFYKIKIAYGNETQTRLFAFGNFNPQEFEPQIKLDKEAYSWTETVKIMVISPNDNQNNQQIDEIKIKISSRAGTLSSYTLEEIGFSHGVFSGIVTLTGHSDFDVNQDGKPGDVKGLTYGVGPEEGNLSVYPNDTIKVSFSTPFFEETLEEIATIQFQKATVEWGELPIYPDQKTIARVIDPDMNLQPEFIDWVKVLASSYPQKYSNEYTLKETAKDSGIFEAEIQLVSQSTKKGFLARYGSTISLMYEDKTLPLNYTAKKLEIIANVIVAKQSESEEIPYVADIPSWVKNTAKWWSEDSIGDYSFIQGIQYLVEKEIIKIQTKSDHDPNKISFVPNWIKNSARWWSEGSISDDDFFQGIQYLVKNGIIVV